MSIPAPVTDWSQLQQDPILSIQQWVTDSLYALSEQFNPVDFYPEFTLGTLALDGSVDARVMKHRGVTKQGILFFAKDGSDKQKQITANNTVSAVYYFKPLGRQLIVTGTASPIETPLLLKSFQSENRDWQAALTASKQSEPLADYHSLEADWGQTLGFHERALIPLPPTLKAYEIVPKKIEFWQKVETGLHHRFLFTKKEKQWSKERLYP